ncbi:MAG TPA: PAS domain S-box protein, partial [Clostridia bacterium]|nr:PAS domain S-box protein [Clostridia bacterium]
MNRPRILTVEDQVSVARELKTRLEQEGYEVVGHAVTGEQAVALAAQLRPDLVLMNIRLQGNLDGIEAAQQIRNGHQTPVVFLTAHSEESTLERAKKAEPYGYIVKPFNGHDLRTVVEIALHKHNLDRCLQDSAAETRAILQTASDGFLMIDAEGRFLDVNESYSQMTGYSREELLKMSIWDLEADESPTQVAANIQRVKAAVSTRFERRHRCKDGRIIEVEVSVNYLALHGGRVFCFIRDITERKQHDEALHRIQQRLSLALSASSMGVWEWDLHTNRLDCSPECLEILGVSSLEPTWEHFQKVLHPDDAAQVVKAAHLALAEHRDFKIEFRVLHPNGAVRWVANLARGVYDEDGKPLRLVGTIQDITDRKTAEEALRESEARYRQLFESGNDAIFLYPVTREQGPAHFVEVNEVACRRLGYSREELLQKSILDINLEFREEKLRALLGQLFTRGEAVFETVHTTKAGRSIPVEINARLIEWRGRKMVLSIARDLTERKVAEAALRESERRFREMLEHVHLASIMLDVERRIIFINDFLLRLTGWKKEEVLGKDWFKLFVPPDG